MGSVLSDDEEKVNLFDLISNPKKTITVENIRRIKAQLQDLIQPIEGVPPMKKQLKKIIENAITVLTEVEPKVYKLSIDLAADNLKSARQKLESSQENKSSWVSTLYSTLTSFSFYQNEPSAKQDTMLKKNSPEASPKKKK